MDVLTRARNQFSERLSAGLQFIEVPEWKDEDGSNTKIYYKPSLNLKQQQKILELSSKDKVVEAIAMTLVLRALDENGKPLFNQSNMHEIMRECDPDVVSRIVTGMNADDLSDDVISKN